MDQCNTNMQIPNMNVQQSICVNDMNTIRLFSPYQGWEFAHLLITHSLICSFCSNQMSDHEQIDQITLIKWATVSSSLRSLKTNERPWANRTGRSEEMSDVSDSLISLTKNERMSELLIILSESLIFRQKTSDSLRNQMSEFPALKKSMAFNHMRCGSRHEN